MHKNGKKTKCILGIDPGSTTIGYSVIKYNNSSKPELASYGYIDLKNYSEKGEKLLHLNKDLKCLFKKYKPGCIAIENIFFFKNLKTATAVMESKGVILFSASEANIKVFEYTPLQVKQTISGYGKADKAFIEKTIKNIFGIKKSIKPDDTSDAIAIGLCHLRHLTGF